MILGGMMIQCHLAQAGIISIDPLTQTVGLGSSINVRVQISGLGAFSAPSLGAYDLNVSFNPLLLQFLGATLGDPILGDQLDLLGLGSIQSVTPSAGSVGLFELSLDSIDDLSNLQSSSFVLGTLSFQTIGLGTSSINIGVNALSDAYGDALTSGIQNGSVIVNASAVPEPNSVLLVGSLAGVLVLGRGFRQRMRGRT
jgi:hypothetical protein